MDTRDGNDESYWRNMNVHKSQHISTMSLDFRVKSQVQLSKINNIAMNVVDLLSTNCNDDVSPCVDKFPIVKENQQGVHHVPMFVHVQFKLFGSRKVMFTSVYVQFNTERTQTNSNEHEKFDSSDSSMCSLSTVANIIISRYLRNNYLLTCQQIEAHEINTQDGLYSYLVETIRILIDHNAPNKKLNFWFYSKLQRLHKFSLCVIF